MILFILDLRVSSILIESLLLNFQVFFNLPHRVIGFVQFHIFLILEYLFISLFQIILLLFPHLVFLLFSIHSNNFEVHY